jgi:predicted N-acetyltransferase YhbS
MGLATIIATGNLKYYTHHFWFRKIRDGSIQLPLVSRIPAGPCLVCLNVNQCQEVEGMIRFDQREGLHCCTIPCKNSR